jgi:hypothetical protein
MLSGFWEGEAPSEPRGKARTEPRPPGSDSLTGSGYERYFRAPTAPATTESVSEPRQGGHGDDPSPL